MLFNLVKSNKTEEVESLGNPWGSIIGYTPNLTLSYGKFFNYTSLIKHVEKYMANICVYTYT